ncbi:MAG TPA: choice-of-anchor L domain-containing protein [Flavobacteriaceae bacterium]|nr:choice-of-anchor L domain-containing protein [Flavobacteriaceae bacterium]
MLSSLSFAQGIEVDDTSYSAQALAEMLLDDGCVEISNVSRSASAAVAYFEDNGSDFPLEEGVIIRSGKAKYSEGPYTGANLSSQLNSNSDPDLVDINNEDGQSVDITDVAFLEFDFIPLSNQFAFDFLFASNEYGEWQCLSSDIFAFLLTNLDTGETENLAVIPGTSTPISVKNIRDQTYNSGCNSRSPEYFDTFNVNDPMNSSVNMKGYTQVLTAQSSMIPGNNYRIRLVIGDSNDAKYDSAVFLHAGSFDASFSLGEDQSICAGDEIELSTGLSAEEYNHSWEKDGQDLGENGASIIVTQPGSYEVTVSKDDGGCVLTDTVVFHELQINPPNNISVCDPGSANTDYVYNLTYNNAAALDIDPQIYDIVFYNSQTDAQNNTNPIPENQLDNYSSQGNETIFIRIFNAESGNFCDALYSFNLEVDEEIIVEDPEPIGLCFSESGYMVDLTQIEEEVFANQNANDLDIDYFEYDPTNILMDPISSPTDYPLPTGFDTETIWFEIYDVNEPNCFDIASFEIIEYPEVPVSEIEDVIECEFFVLPDIEHGGYFTDSGGEGTPLFPGDIIEEEGYYYIYNEDEETGCFKESSFNVILIEKYDIQGTYCGEFEIPQPPEGEFYTDPGGPNGEGDLIPPGTVIETTTTVYFYAEVDGEFCRDDPMEIDIHPIPLIDDPFDVIVCGSYQLPILGGGDYYTQPNGGGQQMSAGDIITSTQQLYIFKDNGTCSDENSFHVYIVPEFEDVEACGSYTLPEPDTGGFYTDSKGQGEEIPGGTIITTSQKIYYYTQTTTSPNCTNYMSFFVTIKPVPEVDDFDDVKLCEEETFILPELENGTYFTESGRNGEVLQPGDELEEEQEIFINNILDGCENETSFRIRIYELPPISNFTDIYTCDPYIVPEPTYGDIYTEPGGQGEMISPGEVLLDSQTLYVYNQSSEVPYCEIEEMFTIHVNYVNVGEIEDVFACDSYVLPELTSGDYYTAPGGGGQQLEEGDTLTTSQTIYVYAQKGDRFVCTDEKALEITISTTPELHEFENVLDCGSYQLPDLNDDPDYEQWNMVYYREPGGQDIIDPEDYLFMPGEHDIYVRAQAPDNPNCFDEEHFTLTINPLLEMNVDNASICVDPETGEVMSTAFLQSGVDPTLYTIGWHFDGELVHIGENFETDVAGTYTITATKNEPENQGDCDYKPFLINVKESSKPIVIAYVMTPDFSDIASIKVEVISGVGDFVYSLDGGPYQEEDVFYNVDSGLHIIRVKDLLGDCGVTKLEVYVIKYPKFFTPNADGINDTWNIRDLEENPEAVVYIFDRYGRLLKSIRPYGRGWDGTFNGKQMPSNDYWFKVEYKVNGENRVFKANFTLKR